jgi:hypothetical protein
VVATTGRLALLDLVLVFKTFGLGGVGVRHRFKIERK